MAIVKIDIPGIGEVTAQNAASESTLKELLAVMKGQSSGSGGGASMMGAAGGFLFGKSAGQTNKEFDKLNKSTKKSYT